GSGKNDHNSGPQYNHVRPEANQHLRRCLSADAAVNVRFSGEELAVLASPIVGDGISHEEHTVLPGNRWRMLTAPGDSRILVAALVTLAESITARKSSELMNIHAAILTSSLINFLLTLYSLFI